MRLALAVAICAAILAGGCQRPATSGRVIVLGLDGMDPDAVDLLIAEGQLPNFATLRREGAFGRLLSSKPLLSPIIWTTIATGKTPDQHRIGHFVAVNEKTGEQLPVTSQMRKVKALWNILSDAGRSVAVVGWWATWPAEPVQGTLVSDHTCYHFLFEEGATGSADATGLMHPPAIEPVLRPMIKRPGDLTPADVAPFAQVSADEFNRPFQFADDLSHFKWALATAESYRAIGTYLWQTEKPDVLMVYVEGTDSVSHLFGHLFRAQGLAGELAAQQQRYGRAVEAMYRYADRLVGEFMALMDERTTLVVLSDHGFELGVLQDDPSKTRDMRRVSERFHRPQGILYLYGNHVKAGQRLDQPTLVDIAPTLLELVGLPPAQDMPGRVLSEGLDIATRPRQIASYEGAAPGAGAAPVGDRDVDPAILERLRALGYLDTHSPKGDRNLAAVLFEEGKFAAAAQAYEALVREHPDDAGLRASWAGALGAVGRYEDSLAQLDLAIELQPLNPEAYHNRGVIFERQGKRDAALSAYGTALRYNPQYAPSQQALVRLTGSAVVQGPRDDAERRAQALAERAGQAARRGDYAGAMQMLDDAEKLAPRYALVYQYRSNVAFLMGDRERAKAALRAALEIEPDNALFQTNLQRLEAGQ
jgi:tetratricopeptide (TPR) repeat protein